MKRALRAFAPLIAIFLAVLVPAAGASKHHYPPGTVKLSRSKIKHVSGIACGKHGPSWLPGVVFSSHWFLTFSRYSRDYKSLARHARGAAKKHDLARARSYAKKAKADKSICNPVAPSGGALASMGAEPAPSIFGINHGTFDSVKSNFGNDEPAAQSLGSRWDHEVLGPSTATGNFESSDYWVKQARSHGMGIVLSFGGISSACSPRPAPSGVASCPPTTASDLSNYESYIESVLEHYHNVVDYYESWKEPNHGSQWGGTANPAQYAALLKAQYQAFQAFNSQHPGSGPSGSNMKLLFASTNGFTISGSSTDIAVLPYVHQVLDDLGGAKAFDAVALHAYRYPPSDGPDDPGYQYVGSLSYPNQGCSQPSSGACNMTWPQELSAVEQEFTDHGYGQPPMWLTEWGWPGGGDCSSLPTGYCLTTAQQDADLKAAFADLLQPSMSFVQGALWFNLRDYQPGVSSPDPAFFYHYGLLNYDYSHKPAADDFKALAAANPNR